MFPFLLGESAKESKSRTQLLADRAAGWLFYVALGVAAITSQVIDLLKSACEIQRNPPTRSYPYLALDHFGDELIFETSWIGHRYEWRIIAPDNTPYQNFRSAIEAEIDDTTGVNFIRVGNTNDAAPEDAESTLTPEQDAAVRAAIEHGYYKRPREIEAYELAEKLGLPGSTLTYRLRRAEAQLAEAYATDHSPSPHLSSPGT